MPRKYKIDEILQQNQQLREQNDILREQNKSLPTVATVSSNDRREVFVDNIDRDEMRSGFLVTSHRKKLWNVQIGLIQEFDRICKKHNLRWFAFSGTLLGAVRHKGFIPWDDDVDLFMLRPDYEKFKQVATQEIKKPYFLDAWFNYKLEREENSNMPADDTLQLVTRKQETERVAWYPFWPMLKLRDSRTSMIQWPDRGYVNQGVWIDIFAFDSAPPFTEKQHIVNWQMARELFLAIVFPNIIKNSMAKGQKTLLPYNELKNFLELTHKQRALQFEVFMLKNFHRSEFIVDFRDYIIEKRNITYNTKDFFNVVYMPFEKIKIPVPIGYENILTTRYGDWHKLVYDNAHVLDYSTDIPYTDYFKTVAKRTPIIKNNQIVGFTFENSQNS